MCHCSLGNQQIRPLRLWPSIRSHYESRGNYLAVRLEGFIEAVSFLVIETAAIRGEQLAQGENTVCDPQIGYADVSPPGVASSRP